MVTLKSLLLLVSLGTEALATTTDVVCASKLGTVSVASNKIPRATTTAKVQVVVVKRVVRKVDVIVVPRPKTRTETVTVQSTVKTTADPDVETATDTVTDEQTVVETRRFTSTSVTTSSSTTTLYTTTTVTKPAGFTGVAEDRGYVAKIKARAAPVNALPDSLFKTTYVQRIDCTKRIPYTSVKTTTTTVKGPRKTLAAKTTIKTVTTTETVTETEYPPDVTERVTETVSPTVTQYDDVTDTSTSTVTVIVETIIPNENEAVYDACGPSNVISSANGGHLFSALYRSTPTYSSVYVGSAKTATQCCVECQKNPLCLQTFFSGSCTLFIAQTNICPNGQIPSTYFTTGARAGNRWVFSNGPCGLVTNGGDS
ncbi:hypothetical protein ACHAPJ_009073 [Fusarium lateritium]